MRRDADAPRAGPARRLLAAGLAGLFPLWRRSCRVEFVDDPRPALRAAGDGYLIAILHAHQLAGLLADDEERLAAMVSRSPDGALLTPTLARLGVEAVRGSARSAERDKGGLAAMDTLEQRLRDGIPVLLTVDGPRGPRGRCRRGVAVLAERTGRPVLPLCVVPSRRLVLRKSWDRFQVPLPGATLRARFGAPLRPGGPTPLHERIAISLAALEAAHDPRESSRGARGTP